MPFTPRLGLEYPALADDPDVPDDMRKLAVSIEAASIGWVEGDFKFSFQPSDHDNFILCDGVPRNRAGLPATYLTLIDSVLGAHPDLTKVRTPDLRRRSPMGAQPGGAPINGVVPNLGALAGEESHLLTANESGLRLHAHAYDEPNGGQGHAHNITDPGHRHRLASFPGLVDDGRNVPLYQQPHGYTDQPAGADPLIENSSTGISINRAGVGITIRNVNAADAVNTHNNVGPVLFGNWFISTGGGGTGSGGGGGGGLSAPADIPLATANLAPAAGESGIIPLGAGYRLLQVSADHPCRVRLYSTPARRDADVARPIGTDPPDYPTVDSNPNHGVMAEVVLTAAHLSAGLYVQDLAPNVVGSSGETPRLNDIAYRVDNTDVAGHVVNLTFVNQVLEAA